MDFKEQIKSPKWQRRRLEILNRDKFTCQSCGSTEQTLHVHHIRYFKDRMYWDYPDNLLITLCEECHSTEHLCKSDFIKDEIDNINSLGITYIEICGMLGCIHHSLMGDAKTEAKTIHDTVGADSISYFITKDVDRISKWRESIKK